MVRIVRVDEPPVEIERHRPGSDVEGKMPEAAFIDFPSTMPIFEVTVTKMLHGSLQVQFRNADFRAAEIGDPKAQNYRRELDVIFAVSGHCSLNLALIVFAIEPDDDVGDPRFRKSVKN